MTTLARPDLYPTRVAGEAVPRPRLDPSVWGAHEGRSPRGSWSVTRATATTSSTTC